MTRHGMWGTSTYNIWRSMKQRCLNPNATRYEYYGGRGITVCEEWLTFEGFYDSMGERPDGMSIERRDNSQGYSPENCYWATTSEQMKNRRSFTTTEFHSMKYIRERYGRFQVRIPAGEKNKALVASFCELDDAMEWRDVMIVEKSKEKTHVGQELSSSQQEGSEGTGRL